MKQWHSIETEKDYEEVTRRYERVRTSRKGTKKHTEKLHLALLINQYEEEQWSFQHIDSLKEPHKIE